MGSIGQEQHSIYQRYREYLLSTPSISDRGVIWRPKCHGYCLEALLAEPERLEGKERKKSRRRSGWVHGAGTPSIYTEDFGEVKGYSHWRS
jgi:hypothetical protein